MQSDRSPVDLCHVRWFTCYFDCSTVRDGSTVELMAALSDYSTVTFLAAWLHGSSAILTQPRFTLRFRLATVKCIDNNCCEASFYLGEAYGKAQWTNLLSKLPSVTDKISGLHSFYEADWLTILRKIAYYFWIQILSFEFSHRLLHIVTVLLFLSLIYIVCILYESAIARFYFGYCGIFVPRFAILF